MSEDERGLVSLRIKKCCCSISLEKGAKAIAAILLTISLGLYVCYLIFLEDIRETILEKVTGIRPCTFPPIDTFTDVLFEYSILSNLLLIFGCTGCTRWLLVPWLVMYFIHIFVFLGISIGMFAVPLPILAPEMNNTVEYQLLRFLGFVPFLVSMLVAYFWVTIRSLFIEMGKAEKSDTDICCPLKMKTGVQIIGGILSILSGVLLVLYFAKLDSVINEKYKESFGREMSRSQLTLIAGLILLAVLVNILLILGGSGRKWRRTLLLPWLLYYGTGIILCLIQHLYFTSLCWREEKIKGMVCLGTGFLFLILWSLVWITAAEMADKQKTLIARPNPLGFQRL